MISSNSFKYRLILHTIYLQCQFALLIHCLKANFTFFIEAAFSSKTFSGKTSSPVKNSYLLTLPDDEAEILTVCPFNHIELCFA